MSNPHSHDGQQLHQRSTSDQNSLDLPLPPQSLVTATQLKRLTLQQPAVAILYGGRDSDLTTNTRISLCAERLHLSTTGEAKSHSRCKHRLCASCAQVNARKWGQLFTLVPEYLGLSLIDDRAELQDASTPQAVGLSLTLNLGQSRPIADLSESINLLHDLWPRLLRLKKLSDHLSGAIRATEITVNTEAIHDVAANPHIHATILLEVPDKTKDIDAFLSPIITRITSWWKRSVTKELRKRFRDTTTEVSRSAQDVRPLTQHDSTNLTRWCRYITKGAINGLALKLEKEAVTTHAKEEMIRVWLAVYEATKHTRLISACGSIKDALADAKADLKRESQSQSQAEPQRETHRWSYRHSTYLPVEEWTVLDSRPHDYAMRQVSHLLTCPLYIKMVMKHEQEYQLRKTEYEKRAILHTLQTGQSINKLQGHLSDW